MIIIIIIIKVTMNKKINVFDNPALRHNSFIKCALHTYKYRSKYKSSCSSSAASKLMYRQIMSSNNPMLFIQCNIPSYLLFFSTSTLVFTSQSILLILLFSITFLTNYYKLSIINY